MSDGRTAPIDPGSTALVLLERHLDECTKAHEANRDDMREIRKSVDAAARESRDSINGLAEKTSKGLQRVHERIDGHESARNRLILTIAGAAILALLGIAGGLMYMIMTGQVQ